jgi:hypothetical protein
MMKREHLIFFGWKGLILTLAFVMFALLRPAYCQLDGTTLLLLQNPDEGGTVTPAAGVHYLEQGAEVTLTAVPQPGFQFVCWLGDVSDAMANSTLVYLDAPKIVIAVFETAEFELAIYPEHSTFAPGGGLVRSPTESTNGGFDGSGGERPSKQRSPQITPPPKEDHEFPVPEEGNDFPVPQEGEDFPVPEVPEPATICLLGLGGLIMLRKRRPNKKCS